MISDDSPSEMSIIAVGFISRHAIKYERLFELPVSVDALLNKYGSKSGCELGFT
jgi:hypothetical protein